MTLGGIAPARAACLPGESEIYIRLRHPTGYVFGTLTRLPLRKFALALGTLEERYHHRIQAPGQCFKSVVLDSVGLPDVGFFYSQNADPLLWSER